MGKETEYQKIKLKNCLSELPKSPLPASAAEAGGVYPFYCSSAEAKQINTYLQEKPAILMGTGGVASINYGENRFSYSTDTWGIRSTCDSLPTEFLYRKLQLLLPLIDYKGFEGSGLRHLRKSFIRELTLEIPKNKSVSKKIAAILTTVDTAIEKTESLIEKYRKIKTGLMNDLFTRGIGPDGKLRPPRSQAPELYKKTELGWIPNEWEVKSLKQTYKNPIRDFGSFSSTNLITFLEDGVPFIKSEMIKEENIDWTNIFYISEEVHNLLSKSYVCKGHILFSKIGSALGKAVLYDGSRGNCNSNAAIAKIEVDEQIVLSRFMEIFLNSRFARSQFDLMIISLLPRINLGDINKLLIGLPNIDEQKKICDKYLALKNRIESEDTLLDKLQKQKAGLMQDLLTGKVEVSVPDKEVVHG